VLNALPASDFDQIGREFTNSPGARVQVGVAAISSSASTTGAVSGTAAKSSMPSATLWRRTAGEWAG